MKYTVAIALIGVLFFTCSNSKVIVENTKTTDAIDQIISQMTLKEKIGQMTQLNLDVVCEGEIYKLVEPHHIEKEKLHKALVEYGVGSILNCGGHAYPREQWLEIIGEIQRVATTETRLKIPVLYGIDAIHGANYVSGSTLFPQPLAQAATFNTDLAKKGAEITAYETRAAGQVWNFSPVLDVARNPLWSRVFETYGEDTYLCMEMGNAVVMAYQGEGTFGNNNVLPCLKHFLGYSATTTGKDRTPALIPTKTLREIYLPPFQKAIESGAKSVMINSGEINGEPVHASYDILTTLLRDELKFEGIAVTDWEDVIKLEKNHHVAANLKEAVYQAVQAGIDMCMVPNDYNFSDLLFELVNEGRITEARIDQSVRRILMVKRELGLLKNTLVPTIQDYPDFGAKTHQEAALKCAEESITLLENKNNTLPLNASQKVFVTGPSSNSMALLNGPWTRTWQGTDTTYDDASKNTIVEAMRTQSSNIIFDEGYSIFTQKFSENALDKAKDADVIVVCLAEMPGTEKPGDINDLTLQREQLDYVKALSKLRKKLVLVLVENRPRVISEIVDLADAIVMCYLPGDFGGDALANILYGKVNPTGKLPITYPRYVNDLLTYDHKYTEAIGPWYGNEGWNPQWPFGHGLGYCKINYKSISTDKKQYSIGEDIRVTITLSNEGAMDTKESILIFQSDLVADLTPSVRKLVQFEKVSLKAGETRTIEFTIKGDQLKYYHPRKGYTLEPGQHKISVAGLEAMVELGL